MNKRIAKKIFKRAIKERTGNYSHFQMCNACIYLDRMNRKFENVEWRMYEDSIGEL